MVYPGLPGLPIDFFFQWEHGLHQRYLFKPLAILVSKLGQELPKQKELRIVEAEPSSPSSSEERNTFYRR